MQGKPFLLLACAAMAFVLASPADAQRVYRWVDEHGVVHFGDAIPPEYSRQQHDVMDSRGVRTTINPPREAQTAPAHDDRDRALLATYRNVEEIEAVRDRRAGYLDAQNAVAQSRLRGLQQRKAELEDNPTAINELATVDQRIREYDTEIERRNAEIARIRDQFDDDIARFRTLKGLDAPAADGKSAASPPER